MQAKTRNINHKETSYVRGRILNSANHDNFKLQPLYYNNHR